MSETRNTFTVPEGHVAVIDAQGRATGETRPLADAPAIEDPAPAETFARSLAALHVRLPLDHHAAEVGVVVDAAGHDVFCVDTNGERDDEEVLAIATWIICAVNTCGGFRAEVRSDG